MTAPWKRLLAASSIAILVAACAKEAPKTNKGKESAEKSESKEPATKEAAKGESKAATATTPAAPTPSATAATPPSPSPAPSPSPSPSAPPPTTIASDTAAPPDGKTAANPMDRFPDPNKKAYTDYVIHTVDGQDIAVKWYWKDKDRITFQRAGGEISLKIESIKSIEGRKDTD